MLPIYLHAFLGPLLGPRHQHLLGSGLTWTLDDIHAPPQRLPDPVGTLLLSAVAGIHPQMAEARKSRICPMQQRLDPFVIHHLGAVDLGFEHETLGIHQEVALAPFDLLASVVTSIFSADRGALETDWLSTTPALGWGSLFKRTLRRWRIARLILSQVPSIRHCLK